MGRSAARPNVVQVAALLQRVKWLLWHGNVVRALQTVDDLTMDIDDMDIDDADGSVELAKLGKAVGEFGGCLAANASCIPNYGERGLAGETISTSFVESVVNRVISRRMVKRQQMRWSPGGAHLLLQIRTPVLNDTLADDHRRWYPGFTHTDRQGQAAEPPRLVPLSTQPAQSDTMSSPAAPLPSPLRGSGESSTASTPNGDARAPP